MNQNLTQLINTTLNEKYENNRAMLLAFAKQLIADCGKQCDNYIFDLEGYVFELDEYLPEYYKIEDQEVDTSYIDLVS